ncbi:MAG: HugZ family protein [Alphaproteobacteria bacterium]|nr:HugZ family protein [Alphaproteobacteria bacterium]
MVTRERSFSGNEARRLLRRAHTGTLATLNSEDGRPYASLANVATDVEGWPLILVSTLAWHTRNLLSDDRASLLVSELPVSGDALTGARVTVMGRFEQTNDPAHRRRYLARHPEAEMYAGFGDFAFWRMEPAQVHAVAGFGRIETLEGNEVFPSCAEMVSLEEGAIAHMNDDHAAAVEHYAVTLLGAQPGPWRIAGIDPDGADLCNSSTVLRLPFESPVTSGEGLRLVLAQLARTK